MTHIAIVEFENQRGLGTKALRKGKMKLSNGEPPFLRSVRVGWWAGRGRHGAEELVAEDEAGEGDASGVAGDGGGRRGPKENDGGC